MFFAKTPIWLQQIRIKNLHWKINTKKKKLFLTFDDGPIPEVTPDVLSILDEYNAKATFFMVGENAMRYPEIVFDIQTKGHRIGNHSYNHLKGWETNNKEYIENIQKAKAYINSRLLRPPYGKIKLSQLKSLRKDYQIIMWTVLSGDFKAELSNEHCLDNILKNVKDGAIIVFHDSLKAKEKMLYILPKILKHYSLLGYDFEAIEIEKLRKHT